MQCFRMRLVGTTLVTVLVLLALGPSPGDAQFFSSRRYCTLGGSSDSSGEPDCSYNTWEQCRASASGLARYCGENPFYVAPAREARPQESNKKRKSKSRPNN
jgi:hypothetical protein